MDSRKFTFTDCRWKDANGRKVNAKLELKSLANSHNPNALLTKACRQLADNYEENKGFGESSVFRQIAMESKRLENDFGLQFWTLHWWYWLTSFYGESWKRALGVLGGVLLIFAFAYMFTPFQICPVDKPFVSSIQQNLCVSRTLVFTEAILQSLATATFQNIEYQKTITYLRETAIILEKIFAPLQAALIALAIRRKFIR